jgi:hypothetical protein
MDRYRLRSLIISSIAANLAASLQVVPLYAATTNYDGVYSGSNTRTTGRSSTPVVTTGQIKGDVVTATFVVGGFPDRESIRCKHEWTLKREIGDNQPRPP